MRTLASRTNGAAGTYAAVLESILNKKGELTTTDGCVAQIVTVGAEGNKSVDAVVFVDKFHLRKLKSSPSCFDLCNDSRRVQILTHPIESYRDAQTKYVEALIFRAIEAHCAENGATEEMEKTVIRGAFFASGHVSDADIRIGKLYYPSDDFRLTVTCRRDLPQGEEFKALLARLPPELAETAAKAEADTLLSGAELTNVGGFEGNPERQGVDGASAYVEHLILKDLEKHCAEKEEAKSRVRRNDPATRRRFNWRDDTMPVTSSVAWKCIRNFALLRFLRREPDVELIERSSSKPTTYRSF